MSAEPLIITFARRSRAVVETAIAAELAEFSRCVTRRARQLLTMGRKGPVGTVQQCVGIVHGWSRSGRLRCGLSNPSKMPGRGWGLPAGGAACPVGAALTKVENSTCSKCYAQNANYQYPSVVGSLKARWFKLQRALAGGIESAALWVAAMARLIRAQSPNEFRWHDSGDAFTERYQLMIHAVCRLTPTVKHWQPTRERGLLTRLLVRMGHAVPRNLCIRLSAPMLGQAPTVTDALRRKGVRSSTVGWSGAGRGVCPAPQQGGRCDDCRRCWQRAAPNSDYPQH